jgi:hypothetical protein
MNGQEFIVVISRITLERTAVRRERFRIARSGPMKPKTRNDVGDSAYHLHSD